MTKVSRLSGVRTDVYLSEIAPVEIDFDHWYTLRVELDDQNIIRVGLGAQNGVVETLAAVKDPSAPFESGVIAIGAGPNSNICFDNVKLYEEP